MVLADSNFLPQHWFWHGPTFVEVDRINTYFHVYIACSYGRQEHKVALPNAYTMHSIAYLNQGSNLLVFFCNGQEGSITSCGHHITTMIKLHIIADDLPIRVLRHPPCNN